MKKLDVRLIRLIKDSKGQFVSITLIIILALSIFVSFNMTAKNMENTVEDYYQLTNLADITVYLYQLPRGVVADIGKIAGVKDVQGRTTVDVPLRGVDLQERVSARVISVPIKADYINQLYMLEGEGVGSDPRGVVVIEKFATARDITIGETIYPFINGKVYELKVKGIAASPEYVYLLDEATLLPADKTFGVLYVSEDLLQEAMGYEDTYSEVLITLDEDADINQVTKSLEADLERYGVKRIISREENLSNLFLVEEINQLKQMATAVPLLFLIVAAIIIVILLSRVVKNDRTTIGVLKALGYKNKTILFHYTKYVLTMGLTGSILGIILGIILSGVLANLYIQFINIPMLTLEVYYVYVVYGILLTCLFCVFAGLLGAKSTLKIMPAESMGPEAPKAGGRIFFERFTGLWKKISFSWKMVIRNIVRNKRRFAFLVLGISLTYGIIVVPLQFNSAFGAIFSIQFGEFQKMDYGVDFIQPMEVGVIEEIRQKTNASKIEPVIEIPFEVKYQEKSKVVGVMGLPIDTEFYQFRDERNRIVPLPEEGVLLAEGLAEYLGIAVGDSIYIKNYFPEKSDIELEVKGLVRQYLGTNVYMNIKVMEGKITGAGSITGVHLDSQDQVKQLLGEVNYIASIQSMEDMRKAFEEYTDLMVYSIGILMVFAGILGFAIVYNSTVISIEERKMEFSSLRVLGFHKKDLYRLVRKENGVMAFLGILFGIPIGRGMTKAIISSIETDLFTVPIIINRMDFIIAAAATLTFLVLAQLATKRRIKQINFIESLKSRVS